jgi:hypothetical protein
MWAARLRSPKIDYAIARRLARCRPDWEKSIDGKESDWDESRWGRRRESNATSANYDLAALPLSYTGPRCRTLCDGLASYNQNLSHVSGFPEHLTCRRVVQPARTSCRPAAAPSSPRSANITRHREHSGTPSAGCENISRPANQLAGLPICR